MLKSIRLRAEEQFVATQKQAQNEKERVQRGRAEQVANLRALRLAKEAAAKKKTISIAPGSSRRQASVPEEKPDESDKNAEAIAVLLNSPVLEKKINLPRGGYLVRRGRGRVIVERAQS